MSRCAVVDADGDPAHTITLVSLMKEEYEKDTSAEGFVDYRAAGLLVSGCKAGKEQLEQQVQSSYQENLNEDLLCNAPDSGKGESTHEETLFSGTGCCIAGHHVHPLCCCTRSRFHRRHSNLLGSRRYHVFVTKRYRRRLYRWDLPP